MAETADNADARRLRRNICANLHYLRLKLTADGFSSKIPAMANGKQILELSWTCPHGGRIGKENRPRLQPRVLIHSPEASYQANFRAAQENRRDAVAEVRPRPSAAGQGVQKMVQS